MPRPKQFTDEELRQRKNAATREKYHANIDESRAKGRAMYRKLAQDPEFLKEQAIRARERRRANPEVSRAANAKRRAEDPEGTKAAVRAWFAANPDKRAAYQAARRARQRGANGNASPDIKVKLMRLQRGRCAACGISLLAAKPHLDHITPLSKGGAHEDANLQLLCWKCNQQKHSKDPIAFMQLKGKLL